MLSKTFFTFASLLAVASALSITKPAAGDKLDFSVTNEVVWSSVDTDTSTLSVVLVDNSAQPPSSTVLAATVNTKDGKYSFSNVVAKVGTRYQINLVSKDPLNTGILAQSPNFEVTKSGVATTTSPSGSNPTPGPDGSKTSTSSSFAMPTAVGAAFGVAAPALAIAAMIL